MQNTIPTHSANSTKQSDNASSAPSWTRHLGTVLATTLIFVSGTSFVSLLEAFH